MRMNTPAPTSVPAVVLVNLGTPDAPTPKAVRRYLAEFLHDHRVVALTRWLWCPILHFVILPFRSPRVAKLYAGVWMDGGSPLAVHTARLTEAVQRENDGAGRPLWLPLGQGEPVARGRRDGAGTDLGVGQRRETAGGQA